MKRLIAALALIAGTASAMPVKAADIELKISTMFPSTHFIQTLALEPWAKAIEEKTNGKVHFTFFPAGSALGNATRQFDQVRNGIVDIAVGIPAIPRGRHPRTVLIELPFTVPNATVGTCALMKEQDDVKADFPGTHKELQHHEAGGVHGKGEDVLVAVNKVVVRQPLNIARIVEQSLSIHADVRRIKLAEAFEAGSSWECDMRAPVSTAQLL